MPAVFTFLLINAEIKSGFSSAAELPRAGGPHGRSGIGNCKKTNCERGANISEGAEQQGVF